jgi:hypothetical protein
MRCIRGSYVACSHAFEVSLLPLADHKASGSLPLTCQQSFELWGVQASLVAVEEGNLRILETYMAKGLQRRWLV